MTIHILIGIAALVCTSACGMTATLKHYEMMDKVNEKLPKDEQFDPAWWYLPKTQGLWNEYKRLYPDGDLLLHVGIATILMVACLLISAWGFGFFGPLVSVQK